MEIEARIGIWPWKLPDWPANWAALPRTFVMRKTRAKPADAGARIGTPLKMTWFPRTRPWNTFGTEPGVPIEPVGGITAAVDVPPVAVVAVPTTVEQPPRPA